MIFQIVDLVKAVNAWNHSAFGNVLPMPQSKLSLCLYKGGFVGVWSKVSGAGLRISYRVSIETRDLETFHSIEEYRVSNVQYRVSLLLGAIVLIGMKYEL